MSDWDWLRVACAEPLQEALHHRQPDYLGIVTLIQNLPQRSSRISSRLPTWISRSHKAIRQLSSAKGTFRT